MTETAGHLDSRPGAAFEAKVDAYRAAVLRYAAYIHGIGGDAEALADMGEARAAILRDREILRRLAFRPPSCAHDWRDARNEIIESGEMSAKCGMLRAGPATP